MFNNIAVEGYTLLHNICQKALDETKIRDDWKIAVIMPVYNEVNCKTYQNYPGMILLSVRVKVDERVYVNIHDHIFALKQVSSKVLQQSKKVRIAFLDLE